MLKLLFYKKGSVLNRIKTNSMRFNQRNLVLWRTWNGMIYVYNNIIRENLEQLSKNIQMLILKHKILGFVDIKVCL